MNVHLSADSTRTCATEEASPKRQRSRFTAKVLTTLLYGCESWTVYQNYTRKLNHFHSTCLGNLLGIKWQNKIPDTEVLRRASLFSIYTFLTKSQLRWARHVVRMPHNRTPKRLFFGKLQQEMRSLEGQKTRYKNAL